MSLKHTLKCLFSWIILRVRSGPIKGFRWIATSGGGFITGRQEFYKTRAFTKNFKKGDVFFDIGAHIGYFSAIAANINQGEGHIYAFEPRPMNARFFRRHMIMNKISNFTLFEAAVGSIDSEVMFDSAHGSATGFISEKGDIKVKQIHPDRMVETGELLLPGFVKIDVEGAECEVLKGLQKTISVARPRMIVATHNEECHNFVIEFLKSHSYQIEVLLPDGPKGDTEILALP